MNRPNIEQIEARANAATPGTYEPRCKEFSNYAPLEIWTEFGWLNELPKSYREPTIELLAHARTDIPELIAYVRELEQQADKLAEALRKCSSIIVEDNCDECGTFQAVRYEIKPVVEALAEYEAFKQNIV